MKTIDIIGMAVIILLAVAVHACIVPDDPEIPAPIPNRTPVSPQTTTYLLPCENLPGTFKLIAVVDGDTPGTLDINEEAMSMISGDMDVGEIKAVQGMYSFEGGSYDVFVTIIECIDSTSAANAVENHKNQPDFARPPSQTVSRFGTVEFNEHAVTEVRMRPLGDGGIRYGYVWSNDDRVFIVEPGTDDKLASMELARMTGY